MPPKCKSRDSRKAAFSLLSVLCNIKNIPPSSNINDLVEYLKKAMINPFWRTNSFSDWNISNSIMEKSKTGFVGVKNLGCICYMISLIQQLYMIPDFRESIMNSYYFFLY